MLVFGVERDIKGIITLEELRKEVLEAEGFIIAAHPFRGFLTFGVGKLGLSLEKAMERPLFQWVDGVEVLNSRVTQKENSFASSVAEGLGLRATGGSDSHDVSEVGIYASRFSAAIDNEQDLIDALKSRDGCQPLAFRKKVNTWPVSSSMMSTASSKQQRFPWPEISLARSTSKLSDSLDQRL